MDKIRAFSSTLIPMLIANVDTDQIIPAQFVSSRTTEEFAHALFRNRRDRDPEFILDQPAMQGRSIILAGPNFGCGSSREAAPWALVAGGIRAVISTGFGDIFNNNSLKNGLLPIVVSETEHERLRSVAAADPDVEVTVDLPGNTLSVPAHGITIELRIDPFYRHLLISGMDELDYLLSHVAEIEQYEAGDAIHPTTRAKLAGR
ncbi:MAG TPA: 3-isopropylmalate dehydratase small subunit [Pseudonocardiaceae bacterium]|nr:3-isopropylmalate dehydratase small subunit [Pseudonocardiaceae bacterium]